MGRKQVQALFAALISTPIAAQDYNPILIAPQIFGSSQTMTATNLGDDNTRLVQLGFPFEYYGNIYTSAWVSSNGFVSFYGPDNLCCNGFPMEQAQRNTIYAYWTDLISGGNPYYRLTQDSALFGWYNTNEYGTQNKNTFEINLSANGNIQINYGAVANTYHQVSAGLTGPTSSDNIQLFFGTNVSSLSFQSGLLTPSAPEPVFSPVAVSPTPTAAPNPLTVTIPDQEEQIASAEAAADEAVAAAEEVLAEEPAVSEPVAATDAAEESVSEEVTQEAEPAEDANDPPPPPGLLPGPSGAPTGAEGPMMVSGPRRDRNVEFFQSEAAEEADIFQRETVLQASLQNVAFVAQADAQYAAQYGEQTTTDTLGQTYSLMPTEGPTFSPVMTTVIGSDTQTPSGQAQQMEILGLGMQGDLSSGEPKDIGDVNNQDGEAMAQLSAVPVGYASYTQARIPDAPFYQPRDIYRGRRIPDANLALYRMMRGQDERWSEMVEDQYE